MAAAAAHTNDVEMVMVNDGSPDASLDLALALHRTDPRVVVIDLARNFGHHKAMMTGLAHASGDLVFLIDSDLEEEPEDLAAFHERLAKGDCDVVYGVQERRRGGFVERATGALFFTLAQALSDQQIPRNNLAARLMTREYVRAPGAFDDAGAMPHSVIEIDGAIYLYYTGCSLTVAVPFTLHIGLAVSRDGGARFERVS
jgi:putative glycosyltransferase